MRTYREVRFTDCEVSCPPSPCDLRAVSGWSGLPTASNFDGCTNAQDWLKMALFCYVEGWGSFGLAASDTVTDFLLRVACLGCAVARVKSYMDGI
jgi:hypothetical protein